MSNQEINNIVNEDLTSGESQTVEFIEDFPENSKDLGNEIAAFTTSNSGRIYLGIDDEGNIQGVRGINGINDKKNKDEYLKRIQGITRESINPPIRVEVNFLGRNGNVVIQITVPKGEEPVYYCRFIPYIRDLTSCRKATASEVKELYHRYFRRHIPMENSRADIGLLITTLNYLSDAILMQCDYQERFVKPDIEQMKFHLANIGEAFSKIRFETKIKELGLVDDLKKLADKLEELVDRRIRIDNFGKIFENVVGISNKIIGYIEKDIEKLPIQDFNETIRLNLEYLKDEWNKREKYLNRGLREQLRQTLMDLGFTFHRLGYIPFGKKELSEKLKKIGEKLWSISTHQNFYRGLGFNPFEALNENMEQILLLADDIINQLNT